MHEPKKDDGEEDRDRLGVAVLYDDTSDGGDKVSVCEGLEEPEDSALPMLTSETDRSSAAPSVDTLMVFFIGGVDFALPNCANH